MSAQRLTAIEAAMTQVHRDWRYRWCQAEACCCMGAANCAGQLTAKGFTRAEWLDWVQRHDRRRRARRHRADRRADVTKLATAG